MEIIIIEFSISAEPFDAYVVIIFYADCCFRVTYTGEIIVSPEACTCYKSPCSDSCQRTGGSVSANSLPGYGIEIVLFIFVYSCVCYFI